MVKKHQKTAQIQEVSLQHVQNGKMDVQLMEHETV